MKVIKIIPVVLLLASVSFAQNFSIDRYVIASGGGHSESATYMVDATIGQPIVGSSSSDNYSMEGGFWGGFGPPPGGGDCVYIAGDVNNNGTPLELGDVVAMIGNYRGVAEPAYTCDCGVDPPGSEFAATADPNGNCIALELGDVVTEIGAYRGTAEASGCPDCPGSLRLLPGGQDQPVALPRLKSKVRAAEKLTSE